MLTERTYGGEFLISEAPRTRSREKVIIAASQTLKAGRVVGQVSIGALSAAFVADAGNTGTGTMGTITVAAGTAPGAYRLVFIEPAANAGTFMVEGPDGVEIGQGTVAVAFSGGGLGFTLADATDWVVKDGGTITVTDAAATDEAQYKGVSSSATDGSQNVAGILWDDVTTAVSQTKAATIIARDAEVDLALLDFGSLDTNHKNTAKAQLAALGIVIRS